MHTDTYSQIYEDMHIQRKRGTTTQQEKCIQAERKIEEHLRRSSNRKAHTKSKKQWGTQGENTQRCTHAEQEAERQAYRH